MITGTLAAGAHPGSYNGNDAQRGNLVSFDWQTAGSERTSIVDEPGATRGLSSSKTLAVAYNIQQNDGGQHRRPDRPEGGMYVKETDTALTVGSTDQTVVAASLGAHHGRQDLDHDTYIFEPRYARNGRGAPDTIAPPLKAQNGGTGKGDGAPVVVAQPLRAGRQYSDMGDGQTNVVVAAMHETGQGFWQEGEHAGTLRAEGENRQSKPSNVVFQSGVRRLTPTECTRLQGFPDDWQEVSDADETQAHAREVLHGMWREVGAQNREGRRLRIALALLTPEILLAGVHGGWISWEMAARSATASREIQGTDTWPEGFMCALWQAREARPAPYRRQSFEQLARELGRPVQELPLEGAQVRAYLLGSWVWPKASQEWTLRCAQPENAPRLISGLSDSARYRQLGNAVAVPVARWIGERIVAL